jgi:hypothetical protein
MSEKVQSPLNKENYERWRRHKPKIAVEWSRKHHYNRSYKAFTNDIFLEGNRFFPK